MENYYTVSESLFREEKLIHVKAAYSFMNVSRTPDFYFSGEQHNFWEMVCVLEGNAGITADDRIYTLHAGDIIFHKPMEFHKIWSVDDSGMKVCILSFDAEGKGLEALKNSTFKTGEKSSQLLSILMDTAEKAFKRSDGCMISGVKSLKNMQIYFNLLELFLLETSEEKDLLQIQDKDALIFSEIVQLLKERVDRQITVDEIAKQIGISTSGMKKIFHKYTGMGLREYHTQLQIKRAMELLKQNRSVLEISEKLSYSSQFYFSNVFKKETGMSPTAYRKHHAVPVSQR